MPATVLVADDNSNIQRMVSLELQGEGFRVIAVGNGEAAIRKIAELRPDLVLADVFMPVRTGYEVCEFVKKNDALAGIPVVLLIGAFDPLDEGEVQRVRADGVLKKPFVPPDPLVLTVKQLLERSGVTVDKREPAKAGGSAPSFPTSTSSFEFVGNDHTPVPHEAFVPPTPPVPRPYPPEPTSPGAPASETKPSEPGKRAEQKVEEQEDTPQDWITRPEPVAFVGREEDKPLVFSELLEETASAEPAQPLTPEDEVRELLKDKTSAYYDFDDVETEEKLTTPGESRAEPTLTAPPTPPDEKAETAPQTEEDTEPAERSPLAGEQDWSRPEETAMPASDAAGDAEQPAEESEPRRGDSAQGEPESVSEETPVPSEPPITKFQGWLRETFRGETETPSEPPQGKPVQSAEEAAVDVPRAASPFVPLEENPFGTPGEVTYDAIPGAVPLRPEQRTGPPMEEIAMEPEREVEQTLSAERPGAPELPSAPGEVSAGFEENLAEPARQDEGPAAEAGETRLTGADESSPHEPFWSVEEPPAVEQTTESIRTERFATESFVTEPPAFDAPPAGESSSPRASREDSSLIEEPFLSVPVSEEPAEADQASVSVDVGAALTEPAGRAAWEPRADGDLVEPLVPPLPRAPEPASVKGEPEFQLTPPPGPAPENGELVQKVVEEVMSRLSPELLEEISRELVKPLAEAVLKRNRPKPE